ncbi:hypothetical protein [Phytomonospora endophytica]|uniref:Uncharacterized protein n=1 Tax=Phytomonospora endophytica TaxID=714109 RepID=A0A841G280_9ACTN|nr:hypothetical protein [Phytomonospora endophytica]MBB6040028.1 hypothetical protein [Phytomonospora endophytica]GIG65048.1 hypothetical protein Pen01_13430 [Phytomonospora endophytica]
MTGPYPPPQQPWQNDGSWQQPQPGQQPGPPPPQDPTAAPSYDLYPQTGGWPDPNQAPPPQAPAYGPPPGPPVYGPTSAPPYGPTSAPPYGPPGQFMPPGPPQAPQNNNKGWIFGGLAVAAVVVLLVVGFVVVNAMSSDDNSNNSGGGDSGNSGSSGDDGDDSSAAKYKEVDDLCSVVSESSYSDVLGAAGAGTPSNTDYGSGPAMSCYQDLEGNEYDLGTLATNATLFDDTSQVASTYDSYLSVYETGGVTGTDVSGLGERAKIVFDDAIIPSAYLIVQDGNLVADVRLSTTEDAIGDSALQTAVEAVMRDMLTGLAA